MTNAQKIRQKFINLMYLVFILFAFIYAPTNTLDSLLYSSRTLKRVNQEALHLNQVLRDSIQYDLQFSQQNPDMIQLVNSLNDSISSIIKRLDSLELVLTEKDKKGVGPFPAQFRSANMANRTFVYNNTGENLRRSIERLKNSLVAAGLSDFKNKLDSLIPTSVELMNSKGQDNEWLRFFLAKTPKALLLNTMEKIKADLLYINNDVLTHLNKKRLEWVSQNAGGMGPGMGTGTPGSGTPVALSDDNSFLIIKLTSGLEAPIKLDWSLVGTDSLRDAVYQQIQRAQLVGRIRRDGSDVAEAIFNIKPQPKPQPKVEEKPDHFHASIAKGPYDEVYLGIENPVTIEYEAPEGYTRDVVISEGTVINRGNKTYVAFKREGYVKLSVYATKGAERRLLQERDLKVILIPNPEVYVSGYKGGVISKDIIKNSNGIELRNDAIDLSKDIYNCQSFDVTLVPIDNPIGEFKVRGNNGSNFSNESREILKNAKRGDVIVIDNFKIKTPEGNIRRIPTVVYRVI